MGNRIKTYFIVPTYDASPDGPIALGNIIANPRYPEERINDAVLPIPAGDQWKTEKFTWAESRQQHHASEFGVLTQFMAVVAAGVDASVHLDGADAADIAFDCLETSEFRPSHEYEEAAVGQLDVQKRVRKDLLGRNKPLYMVTGVKIARGASATTKMVRGQGVSTQFSVNLAPAIGGTPVTVGPHASYDQGQEHGTSWDKSSDFVYAYRLRRIKISKKGEIEGAPYIKSAMLSAKDHAEEARAKTIQAEEPLDIESEDVTTDGLDVEVKEIADGKDGSCLCGTWRRKT